MSSFEIHHYDPFYAHARVAKSVAELRANIEIKLLGPRECMPTYGSDGAAGLDLRAAITSRITVYPGETAMINTGIALNIKSAAIAAFIYPRSGLGKKGLVLANTVGVIDSDYQGEIMLCVWNRNDTSYGAPVHVEPLERIAQLVFQPVMRAEFKVVEAFSEETKRGAGGFGSTGSH